MAENDIRISDLSDGLMRDLFAMAALTGLLVDKYGCDGTIQGYASRSYEFADAMLAERQKERE